MHGNDTSFKDSSINKLTVQFTKGSPTVAPGLFGNAMSFAGADGFDYGNAPFPVALIGTSDMTLEVWVKTSTANGDIVNDREVPHTPGELAYGFFMIGGKVFWGHDRHNFGTLCQFSSTGTVNDNNWHQIVGTWNGTTRNSSLYIDGVFNKSQICGSAIDSATASTTSQLSIGGQLAVFGTYTGLIDEVRLYNRTVSSAEISRHYNNGVSLYSTLGPEEVPSEVEEGFVNNVTTFDDGTQTGNATVPGSVRFVANPNANYTKASVKAKGLQGSPFPSNVVITIADKVVFTETGVFNFTTVIDINVTRINEYLADHPSGHVSIDVTGSDGVIQFSELEVSGTSEEQLIFCNVDEFLDPLDNTCKAGTVFISSAKDKNRYTFSVGGNISNFLSDDAFRWERDNASKEVIISMDYQVNKHLLEITEDNARRVSIDFNTISTLTGFNIFKSLSNGNRQDLSVTVDGDDGKLDDFIFIGIPKPRGVLRDTTTLVEGVDYTYDSSTNTLTIANLLMSQHTLTFQFSSTRAMVTIAQIIAGLGGILLAMTLLMNTEINDPEKIIGNLVKVIIVIFFVVQFLGL